ncbi:b(0,+)-type amino acid transporter 1-like [Diaphorina citri]|uniref:B(0,+)-type amino acid transporter 1-like n=1 Tax=Diaphorina citri TaxID=121845 RepID=A0A1S3DCT5_DIACI|nr:b(0,+)-type amino acid transporter 1-like [Diaphorina citri]
MLQAFSFVHVKRLTPAPAVLFQVPLVIPIFVLIMSIVLSLTPIVTKPAPQFLIAVAFIVLGILVYIPFVYYQYRMPYLDNITYFIQVLLKVVPPDQTDPDNSDTESNGVSLSVKHSSDDVQANGVEKHALLEVEVRTPIVINGAVKDSNQSAES